MRVESAKNNQPDKKDTASNFKPEKSLFDSNSSAMKTADAAAAQPSKGAFEKILTEARVREKDKSARDAAHSPNETASETSEADEKKEANRRTEEKNESKEKNRDDGKGGEKSGEEENSPDFAAAALLHESKTSAQTSVAAPAARSILHIADLERIVSFVRTQNLGDAQQILLSLKHSVLEGLQIRLTLNEKGNLKAEFLALNEQIKKQLKLRERELLEILKKRSARFSEIEILVA